MSLKAICPGPAWLLLGLHAPGMGERGVGAGAGSSLFPWHLLARTDRPQVLWSAWNWPQGTAAVNRDLSLPDK